MQKLLKDKGHIAVKVLLGIGMAMLTLGADRIIFPRTAIAGGFS